MQYPVSSLLLQSCQSALQHCPWICMYFVGRQQPHKTSLTLSFLTCSKAHIISVEGVAAMPCIEAGMCFCRQFLH